MKILFINMPIRVQAAPNIVPTGIGILASLIEEQGHFCNVLDLNSIRPEVPEIEVRKMLASTTTEYDLVGLSGMITTLKWQKKIAAMVRERWPECTIISGGGLASDFGTTLFEWIEELDIVAIGEGEQLLPGLLSEEKYELNQKVVLGPKIFNSLDLLPKVAWEKFNMETYLSNPVWGIGANNSSWVPFTMKRSINLISSRGCPYSCNFCDRRATGGRNYRLCSAERLLQDVEDVKFRFDVDFIGFVDDNFLSDTARLDDFLPRMEETGITWGCHGRLNEVNNSLAGRLRRAGCRYIGFGGESADPSILSRMNKKNQPNQMSLAIKACQENDITPNCTWIMGYPGETRATLRRTVEFIMEHGLSQRSMFVATAYPGTRFFEEVQSKIQTIYGDLQTYVLDLDDATKVLGHQGQILNFSAMSDEQFLECREFVQHGKLENI